MSGARGQAPVTLVTGASGMIGGELAAQLAAGGRRVRCLLRPASAGARLEALPVEVIRADLADPAALAAALAGVSRVYHLAGYLHAGSPFSGGEDYAPYRAANVDLTERLLAASARAAARVLAAGAATDLALLVYSGVYREAFISEPALATLVARELGLTGSCTDAGTRQLLAFDLMNGPPGVLMACQVVGRLLLSRGGTGVVAASEYGETPVAGQPPLAVASAGSALRLERSRDATGFRSFYFASHAEHLERYHAYAQTDAAGPPRLRVVSDPRLQDYYLEALAAGVGALLRQERCTLDDFAVILPPQISPRFLDRLAAALELDPARLVACGTEDLFTSAAAAGWEAVPARAAQPGALGLFLAVGPGIEVACASYRF